MAMETAGARVLVVDDEPELREMIAEYLGGPGFIVTAVDGGAAMRETVARQPFDIVLLDINMPGEDGLSLCRFLREHHRLGIIMVTAAGTTVDRIVGLEIGADDYLPKPFAMRELLARVQAVLRWRPAAGGEAAPQATGQVRFGRCVLDLAARRLKTAEGEDVPVTASEFDLLRTFAANPNRVLSRDELLDLAHSGRDDPFDRSIDNRITRLRRKIESDPARPQVIKTVRGSGYMFVAE
jgi:two-component system phosphate regulon response regulator OmpR